MSRSSGIPLEELRPHMFLFRDKDATGHLMRCALLCLFVSCMPRLWGFWCGARSCRYLQVSAVLNAAACIHCPSERVCE